MKHSKILSMLLLAAATLLTVTGCGSDDPDDTPSIPIQVGTPVITNVQYTSAEVSVTVNGDGITERGILYSTTKGFEAQAAFKVISPTNNFKVNLSGLDEGTTYYVKAYALKGSEAVYSSEQSFTTLKQEPAPAPTGKLVGGDISLLTKYEEHGAIYSDKDGHNLKQKYGDNYLLKFFKEQGMNTMRVRLFVDPSRASTEAKGQGVCQDLEYVKALGKRIKDAGFQFMLDFHYSDTWADPEHQTVPYLFLSVNEPYLNYIYNYTKEALQALVAAGATPDLIQTGNEISFGMLWDGGRLYPKSSNDWSAYADTNWDNFSTALKNAGKACREVCPNAKIILHTEQIANASLLADFYQRAGQNGVDYDIIGLSYYPYYHGNLETMNATLTSLENKFSSKEIMIVETGYYHKYQPEDVKYNYSSDFPITETGQKDFAIRLITILNAKHPRVTGLFWWMMEANEYGLDWNTKRVTDGWYNASLFDNESGKALPALYELQNFK